VEGTAYIAENPVARLSYFKYIYSDMSLDIWMLLAGIGIFLFGIYLMEESLKAISGKAFKTLIRKYTSSKLKSIATGTLSTALLQSSSAVTLMVLAFVGAGIISLTNAFGVILGSNLGTTFTSWIVATVGFKFKIETFALPFIGIGGLGLIFFGRTTRASNISKLMVGFGFLFLGLDYMKTGVEELAAAFDISVFQHYSIFFFLFIGFIITAIMQSSSAAMAIILTAVFGGLIDFNKASAMVIGTNLGTTVTVLLGSIGGVIAKKQVAAGHVIFNFVTGLVAFILLVPLNYLVLEIFRLKHDPVLALALFHTIFNAMGILLFIPLMKPVAGFITRMIKDKKKRFSRYIHHTGSEVPEAAIEAMTNETIYLVRLVMMHNLKLFNLETGLILSAGNMPAPPDNSGSPDKMYAVIKSIQSEIFIFSSELQARELTADEAVQLNKNFHAIHHSVASAKTLKDIAHELDKMEQSDLMLITKKWQEFRKTIMHFYMLFDEMLENKTQSENLPKLIRSMQTLQEDEKKTMKELSHSIHSKEMNEENISSLLSASRSYSLSLRQLSFSVKELILTEQESAIYESFETGEPAPG
jgi:phosphate:Na+ symporter